MDSKEAFNIVQNIFTDNGYTIGENNVKIPNKAKIVLSATSSNIRMDFEKPYPVVSISKTFKFKGRVVFKPSLSRSLTALSFTSSTITLELDNSPDFTIDY